MPTLYINGKDVEAHLDRRRVALCKFDYANDNIECLDAPLHDLHRVVIIGFPKVTLQVLHQFVYQDIPVYFLSNHGRWVGSLLARGNGNAARRIRQYQAASDQHLALLVAKALVSAKIKNMRRVLQRLAANRDQAAEEPQLDACNTLQTLLQPLQNADSLDTLRGYEGLATAKYFQRLADFFPVDMPFRNRNRRPPRDEANAILSWTYSVLAAEIDAQIHTAGLDPAIAFLHEISLGRASLVQDLIEPLRAPLCDLLALNLLNHKLLRKEHFETNPDNGGVYLKKEARHIFFCEYECYMERLFAEVRGGEHTTFRRIIA
ncbi:MAG: CRISPR-associated endonuclease Cas1, partial [Oligosphaeraceae bacterium]|nr:CRISPR-associated endonuclease Cas1 [Oligosphaeraceae bacterium]